MTTSALIAGLALAPLMIAGSFAGKRLLSDLSERTFRLIIEATMLVAGVLFMFDWAS